MEVEVLCVCEVLTVKVYSISMILLAFLRIGANVMWVNNLSLSLLGFAASFCTPALTPELRDVSTLEQLDVSAYNRSFPERALQLNSKVVESPVPEVLKIRFPNVSTPEIVEYVEPPS